MRNENGRSPDPRPAAVELAAGAGLTVAAAVAVGHGAGLPWIFVGHAALAFAAIGAAVWLGWRLTRQGGWLGPANRVTLARAGLVALLAGLVPAAGTGVHIGWPCALALAALALDGVDGAVARRTGSASAFGARFDMELDAALALVLAISVVAWDRAGAWVLLLGVPRYAFVAAARAWPVLRRPLAPSRRRRVICVIQVAALVVSLAPWPGPPLPALACAAAGALVYTSFAVDVRQLWRSAGPAPAGAPGERP